ncbi:RNA polymerase sigma factor [Variovorax sp. LT1R16]|uniref:RNA polymerase sigma factor n=1 Tax=Variovorax sp. LT1R16 TaxID=3443728 RepID=UPI003F482AF5
MPDNALPALRSFLVSRYDELKQRLARRLGNAEQAGDALQDTWLRLESRDDVEGVRDPAAYLLRVAVNLAYDQSGKQSRLVTRDEIDALLDEVPDSAPGPAQIAEDRSEMAALVSLIARMPARRRQILVMVRWEHLPQREVAARLGISLRTVEKELKEAHDFCAARMGRLPAASGSHEK